MKKFGPHLCVQRVHHLRPVQGDDADVFAHRAADGFVIHGHVLLSRGQHNRRATRGKRNTASFAQQFPQPGCFGLGQGCGFGRGAAAP